MNNVHNADEPMLKLFSLWLAALSLPAMPALNAF
jgi:hypothetical protein